MTLDTGRHGPSLSQLGLELTTVQTCRRSEFADEHMCSTVKEAWMITANAGRDAAALLKEQQLAFAAGRTAPEPAYEPNWHTARPPAHLSVETRLPLGRSPV